MTIGVRWKRRYDAVGYLDGRLLALCFTETPSGIRVISFRKANSREIKRYEKRKPLTDDEGKFVS
jgi:uncharacterized DUF497 family protein